MTIGKKDPDIVDMLVATGVPAAKAQTIVQTAKTQRRNAIRGRGKNRMKRGAILLAIGVAITAGTYLAAGDTGGYYIVSFGPVLLGLYYLALGVSDSMTR